MRSRLVVFITGLIACLSFPLLLLPQKSSVAQDRIGDNLLSRLHFQTYSEITSMNEIPNVQNISSTLPDSVFPLWNSFFSNDGMLSKDKAFAIATDHDGNVYVTGVGDKTFTSQDYVTIKYNSAGSETWVVRYNDESNGRDSAADLVVDDEGDVYVTGSSEGMGTHYDYATVKYDSAGNELWIARYNGLSNADDNAVAVAIDPPGNVYVTGISKNPSTGNDYVTVKYSPDGVEQWVVSYNGPDNTADMVSSIAVDSSGNVYVTGNSMGSSIDYATVKYDTDGNEVWVARYDGPDGKRDEANDIVVDDSGNVYITGRSASSATGDDYATIKYNGSGAEQWISRYDSGVSDKARYIIIDDSGNVYVTGESIVLLGRLFYDFVTIKYSPDGSEQWLARYHQSETNSNKVKGFISDSIGNIYLTGTVNDSANGPDFLTFKYNSDGVEQWMARYHLLWEYAEDIALDGFGNIYVSGWGNGSAGDQDFITIKYDSIGSEQWVERYHGPGVSGDWAIALEVDTNGHIYIISDSYISGNAKDFLTAKYSAGGQLLWETQYDGTEHTNDFVSDIAVSEDGFIYVGGSSQNSGTGHDYTTIKYSPDGTELWKVLYDGPGTYPHYDVDMLRAIAIDGSGSVYVTGMSFFASNNKELVTIKYDSEGIEEWIAVYSYGRGEGIDIEIDDSGNVYILGTLGMPNSTATRLVTIKYDSLGVEQWVDISGSGYDEAVALTLDRSGNAYVTGIGGGTCLTIKYDPDGNKEWQNVFLDHKLIPVDIALDKWENVYISGEGPGGGTNFDILSLKYNSSGNFQWISRYNWLENSIESVSGAIVDSLGNVYISGKTKKGPIEDLLTVKFNSHGVKEWAVSYNGPGNFWDESAGIAVDDDGYVYALGSSLGTHYDWMINSLIKYEQIQSPTNHNPVIVSQPDTNAYQDSLYLYQVVASDIDDDTLAYSLITSPGWLSINTSTGVISGTPSQLNLGDTTISIEVSDGNGGTDGQIFTLHVIPLTRNDDSREIPDEYMLMQNHPNPFNPATEIRYALPKDAKVKLSIYNLLGQEVTRLIDAEQPAGYHRVTWNASNVSSGIYFYRLQAGDFIRNRKMLLLK